ncbi:hypothetical protein ATHL_02510 [Anaerolinea thermolimosa]|uniref:DUF4012 domain-containing protein n=1 Tax=Anaerolinea thermolimosa TaxID=229919 RepID=UPI0007811633|nr:DUF4012 domain-containing protein [Anaerolinea thermolimosa]GAP07624.1 hypothetical protein ATHL_02510 [Anaerolinea thermolimosa]
MKESQFPFKKNALRSWLLLGVMGGILIWLGVLTWHGAGLMISLRKIQRTVGNGVSDESLQVAVQELERINRHADHLLWGMAPLFPVFHNTDWVPGVGGYLSQSEALLLYGKGLAEVGFWLLDGLEFPANGGVFQRQWLNHVETHQENLRKALQAVEAASQARAGLDFNLLSGNLGERLRSMDRQFSLVAGGVGLLPYLPALAGEERGQTYLLVVQNSDELRATGGFISAFGLLQVRRGEVVRFDVKDSYSVDRLEAGYPLPPEPLATYMLAGIWVPRDANWSPDFPTAAEEIAHLYTLSTGVEVDGVLAIDQQVIVQLLAAIGPLTVEGASEAIHAKNVVRWMQQAWEPDPKEGVTGEWWSQRKDFMGHLGAAILKRLTGTSDGRTLFKTGTVIFQMLRQGHLLMYLKDSGAQMALAKAGLDGAVRLGEGDFLMPVDSNIGFNKADALIERTVTYRVDARVLQNPQATLVLEYTSRAQPGVACVHKEMYGLTYADLQNRCYWNYWRVLVPKDSELLFAQVPAVPPERMLNQKGYDGMVQSSPAEGGTIAFAGLLVLPAGDRQTAILSWRLPSRVVRQTKEGWVYELRVQKQPGVVRSGLRLIVQIPEGMKMKPADGWRSGPQPGEWTWEGWLEETTDFRLVFH